LKADSRPSVLDRQEREPGSSLVFRAIALALSESEISSIGPNRLDDPESRAGSSKDPSTAAVGTLHERWDRCLPAGVKPVVRSTKHVTAECAGDEGPLVDRKGCTGGSYRDADAHLMTPGGEPHDPGLDVAWRGFADDSLSRGVTELGCESDPVSIQLTGSKALG
jgi:hypothetical protein